MFASVILIAKICSKTHGTLVHVDLKEHTVFKLDTELSEGRGNTRAGSTPGRKVVNYHHLQGGGVTVVLQCYRGVTVVLQCYRGVTEVLQWCCSGVVV